MLVCQRDNLLMGQYCAHASTANHHIHDRRRRRRRRRRHHHPCLLQSVVKVIVAGRRPRRRHIEITTICTAGCLCDWPTTATTYPPPPLPVP